MTHVKRTEERQAVMTEDRLAAIGEMCPAVTLEDLAGRIDALADRINHLASQVEILARLDLLAARIEMLELEAKAEDHD